MRELVGRILGWWIAEIDYAARVRFADRRFIARQRRRARAVEFTGTRAVLRSPANGRTER